MQIRDEGFSTGKAPENLWQQGSSDPLAAKNGKRKKGESRGAKRKKYEITEECKRSSRKGGKREVRGNGNKV